MVRFPGRGCRPLRETGEDVSIEEVAHRRVPRGTRDDVVDMVFVRLLENVIRDEADEKHKFHFDSRGFQRIRKRRQARLPVGDAFRSLQRPGSDESGCISESHIGGLGLVNVQHYDSWWELLSKLTSFFDDENRCVAKIDGDKESFIAIV
jgi:hypothetical protein